MHLAASNWPTDSGLGRRGSSESPPAPIPSRPSEAGAACPIWRALARSAGPTEPRLRGPAAVDRPFVPHHHPFPNHPDIRMSLVALEQKLLSAALPGRDAGSAIRTVRGQWLVSGPLGAKLRSGLLALIRRNTRLGPRRPGAHFLKLGRPFVVWRTRWRQRRSAFIIRSRSISEPAPSLGAPAYGVTPWG